MKRSLSGLAGLLCGLCASVSAVAQPVHDTCANAIDLSAFVLPFVSDVSDISQASGPVEESMCAAAAYSVWYKFRPLQNYTLEISTCPDDAPENSVPDTVLALYASPDGTCNMLTPITCNDDACTTRSYITAPVAANRTYYLQVAEYDSGPPAPGQEMIQFRLNVAPPPPPDRWIEVGDAADLPGTAQSATGIGPLNEIRGLLATFDVDMYQIRICAPEIFSATTVGGADFDTQLFLFDASGFGVAFNDDSSDSAQSTITNRFVVNPGLYYLAISYYDTDPLDGDFNQLWNDRPFADERAPDDPLGRSHPVTQWDVDIDVAGAYVIRLTGAGLTDGCMQETQCPACAADFNQDGGIDGADVEAFFVSWSSGDPCGDVSQDGGVDGTDVESFFLLWEAGGC
ncbi:MAG: DVUA0089 family protein [Planctomycetes bacterium]|nr:DVUA0089 family protein [Planctomycetota bacterium]